MLGGILGRGSFPRCKSLLKLMKNRIEVVQRKRKATLKFLREDIGDLLHNGLEDNACGRADGLLAELTLSECYDFIENACDFVLRHLPALQKINHCPEDCREAISSLMFAAARFSDLPELRDLRQLFYELYENSIDLYANKKFTENLSTKSFTTERRLRLLEDIASEYKIDWTRDSYKKVVVPKIPEVKTVAPLPKESPSIAPQQKPENLPYVRSVSGLGTGYRSALPPPYTKPNINRKFSESPRHVEEKRRSRERELDEGAMLDELLMKYSTTPSSVETVKLKVLEKGGKTEKSTFPPPASTRTQESAKASKAPARAASYLSGHNDVAKEKDTHLPTPTPMTKGEADPSTMMKRAATYQNGKSQGLPLMSDDDDVAKGKEVEKSINLPVRASSLTREKTNQPTSLTRAATFQNGTRHVHPKLPDYDDLAARFASLRGG